MPVLTLDIPTWLIRFSCSGFTNTASFMFHRVCTAICRRERDTMRNLQSSFLFSHHAEIAFSPPCLQFFSPSNRVIFMQTAKTSACIETVLYLALYLLQELKCGEDKGKLCNLKNNCFLRFWNDCIFYRNFFITMHYNKTKVLKCFFSHISQT